MLVWYSFIPLCADPRFSISDSGLVHHFGSLKLNFLAHASLYLPAKLHTVSLIRHDTVLRSIFVPLSRCVVYFWPFASSPNRSPLCHIFLRPFTLHILSLRLYASSLCTHHIEFIFSFFQMFVCLSSSIDSSGYSNSYYISTNLLIWLRPKPDLPFPLFIFETPNGSSVLLARPSATTAALPQFYSDRSLWGTSWCILQIPCSCILKVSSLDFTYIILLSN